MIRLAANSVLFAGYDLETAMQHIAWAGYDGVELSALKGMCEHLNLDRLEEDVPRIKKIAAAYGLELLAMEEAALDEDRLIKAFQAAAELGIPVVNVGPSGKSDVEEDFRRTVETLAKMAERAATYGVTLCCKAHVGGSLYNSTTLLRAAQEIHAKGFGINLDPSHIYRVPEDPVEALSKLVSYVKHVHIRDCVVPENGPGAPEFQACGRGHIDLLGYTKLLADSGYKGALSLEVIGAGKYELSRVAIIAAESRGYLNACLKACGA